MQLTLYTDYALRVLIYLGTHPGEPIPASQIAHAYEISLDHVSKAAKTLTREGFLSATRGAHGGVELAKSPCEIRVGQVVRIFEGGRGLLECMGQPLPQCKLAPACRLKSALFRAEDAFFAELDAVTLEDIIDNKPQLVRLLKR